MKRADIYAAARASVLVRVRSDRQNYGGGERFASLLSSVSASTSVVVDSAVWWRRCVAAARAGTGRAGHARAGATRGASRRRESRPRRRVIAVLCRDTARTYRGGAEL